MKPVKIAGFVFISNKKIFRLSSKIISQPSNSN